MAIIHLSGNMDRRTVPEARRHLLGSLQGDGTALHIDLGDVEWVDSAGLAILVEVAQLARQNGWQVHLHRVGDDIMKKLRLAHLETVFSICHRLEGPTVH